MESNKLADNYNKLEKTLFSLQNEMTYIKEENRLFHSLLEIITQMAEISHEINCIDLTEIYRLSVFIFSKLLKAKYASIFIYQTETEELVFQRHNLEESFSESIPLSSLRNTFMGYALTKEIPIKIDNGLETFKKEQGFNFSKIESEKYFQGYCLIVPLVVGHGQGNRRVIGVLNLANRDNPFSKEEYHLANIFGELLAGAIISAQFMDIKKNAEVIDRLTQLYQYRFFYEQLKHEIHRADRYQLPLTLVLIDIDNFIKVNETYGNLIGDEVLKESGALIQKTLRNVDIIARYGGDCFVAILPDTPASESIIVGERLRKAFEQYRFIVDEKEVNVTVSVGLAEYRFEGNPSLFVSRVEMALYRARESGGNRQMLYNIIEEEEERRESK